MPASISSRLSPQRAPQSSHVLDAGRVDAHAERNVEHRRHPADDADRPAGRGIDAGEHAQQRRLARAVVADEPDALAVADFEIDPGERGDDQVGAGAAEAPADRLAQQQGLQRIVADGIDRNLDRRVSRLDVSHERFRLNFRASRRCGGCRASTARSPGRSRPRRGRSPPPRTIAAALPEQWSANNLDEMVQRIDVGDELGVAERGHRPHDRRGENGDLDRRGDELRDVAIARAQNCNDDPDPDLVARIR